jgi:hypothetical protein
MADASSNWCLASERLAAGQQLVKNDAERPDVAAVVGALTPEEFRRQITERAGDDARVGE